MTTRGGSKSNALYKEYKEIALKSKDKDTLTLLSILMLLISPKSQGYDAALQHLEKLEKEVAARSPIIHYRYCWARAQLHFAKSEFEGAQSILDFARPDRETALSSIAKPACTHGNAFRVCI